MSQSLQDFNRSVIERSHQVPVLADFWAPWCGPCRMLGPVLEKLAESANGRWELAKVNIDELPEVAQRFNIASIPSVKMFHRGEVVDEFLGVLPEPQIVRWLQAILPSPHADRIAEARRLLDAGDDVGARAQLQAVVDGEPENHAARLLLSEAFLPADLAQTLKVIRGIPGNAREFERADILRELAELLQRGEGAPTAPGDSLQPMYKRGLAGARRRDWVAAINDLIGVVEKQKHYAEDTAMGIVRLIFRWLGPRHPVVSENHRRFSSLVNS